MSAFPSASSSLFHSCRFVLAQHWVDSTSAHNRALREQVASSILAHSGVLDAEVNPAETTHVIVERQDLPGARTTPTCKQPGQPHPACDIEEATARTSRRINVVFPDFIAACIQQRKLLTRTDDSDRKLLSFDCTALVAQERERAARYSDYELLDVEEYAEEVGGTYDPEMPRAAQRGGGRGAGRNVPNFAVACRARRYHLRVGDVVRVALMEGKTQEQEDVRRYAHMLVQTNVQPTQQGKEQDQQRQQPVANEGSQESKAEEGKSEAPRGFRLDMEPPAASSAGDEAKESEVRETTLGGEFGHTSTVEAPIVDTAERQHQICRGRANSYLPREDDPLHIIPTEHLVPCLAIETAFMRIVDRQMHPVTLNTAASYTAVLLTRPEAVYGVAQWSRVRLEPRHVINVAPVCSLLDVEKHAAAHPASFEIESLTRRSNVKVGALIKCVFRQEDHKGNSNSERMFCHVFKVERVVSDGSAVVAAGGGKKGKKGSRRAAGGGQAAGTSVRYRAWLENEPICMPGLTLYDVITVEPRHVLDTEHICNLRSA